MYPEYSVNYFVENNSGGILIVRNSVFNGIPRNFTEFRHLIPVELNNAEKIPPEFDVVQNSARPFSVADPIYFLSTFE